MNALAAAAGNSGTPTTWQDVVGLALVVVTVLGTLWLTRRH